MALDNPMQSRALLIQVAKLLLQRLRPLEVSSESFLGIRSELLVAKQTVGRTISSLCEEAEGAEPHPRFLHQLKDLLCDFEDVVDTICSLDQDPKVSSLTDLDAEKLARLLPDILLWVKNPDFDRVDWLNKLNEHMWPLLNKAICKTASELSEPIIAEQFLPSFLD